jgi:hypothetical protein
VKDLAIVTSCHRYGIYLADWAASIIGLTQRPGMVGIVTHGSDDDRRAGEDATQVLRHAGIRVKCEHHPDVLNYGHARNLAVALSDTAWVMHFDADDMLMPHALDDVAKLAPKADVVSLGYERCGDLASGPRQRVKTYRTHQGAGTLADTTPSSGVSPFRRSFWERSPYRTDMIGGWDTALWLGFAHLGARFVPTTRPCFWYRQHGDSTFNTRRRSAWPAARTGAKLQSLRAGHRGVSVIVPRTVDGAERDAAWRWVRQRYETLFPDWRIIEGVGDANQWRKGEAIGKALKESTGSVLVIADADCVVPADALREAVAMVEAGTPWVVPHTLVHRLNPGETQAWLTTPVDRDVTPPDAGLMRGPYQGFSGGGILVVGRPEYEATGGIPRGFVGWGGEDEALSVILDTLIGPHARLPHDLIHLWHPTQRQRTTTRHQVHANRALYHRYLSCKDNPDLMWTLVQGGIGGYVGTLKDPRTRHATLPARVRGNREDIRSRIGNRFAERRLTQHHTTREATMAAALEMRRAHKRRMEEQRQRNEEAREAKAMGAAPANKMLASGGGVKITEVVRFASSHAEEAAKLKGLSSTVLARLAAKAGPRGITLAMVKETVA